MFGFSPVKKARLILKGMGLKCWYTVEHLLGKDPFQKRDLYLT